MKNTLIIVASILLFITAIPSKAQVGGISYTPYTYGQKRVEEKPTQTQSVTAYTVDSFGNLSKIRLKIGFFETRSPYYSSTPSPITYTEVRVVAYYSGGLTGWQSISPLPKVEKCMQYSNNRMEQSFMYKAWVGTDYVYFDM